jgi:hypothetical protein
MKIIDLDSWETGYADGELGRAPQCHIDSSWRTTTRADRLVLTLRRPLVRLLDRRLPHPAARRN